MRKIKKFILENKLFIFLIIVIVGMLVYCSFNTFVNNDDLPYSFFYRNDIRITNVIQVVKNQIADYFNINGRIIIHSIVQSLLIFDKNLWSVLNPLVIVSGFVMTILIVNQLNKDKENNILKLLLITSLFLCLYDYKYIIYWVAGSVNYVWMGVVFLGFIYYYLRRNINKNYLINFIIITFISILHESSLVFMIIFLLSDFIMKKIRKEKVDKKYLLYVLAIVFASLFTFLCPGNLGRMNEGTWNTLSLIQKLKISVPVVSKNLLCLTNIDNILPIAYVITVLYKLFKIKDKTCLIVSCLTLIFSFVSIITGNGYGYLGLAISLLVGEIYIYYHKNQYTMINVCLGFYAIAFSMILLSEYSAARPNYFFYLYTIIVIVTSLFENGFCKKLSKNRLVDKTFKKFITIAFVVIFICLLGNEMHIYSTIGSIHKERIEAISKCKKESCEVLYLKKIPSSVAKYHIDSNGMNSDYFAYKYFIYYYNLEKVGIKYID